MLGSSSSAFPLQEVLCCQLLVVVNFDFNSTFKALKWRVEEHMPSVPTNQAQYQHFLDTGAFYIAGRIDRAGLQPVIVADVKKFVNLKINVAEFENSIKFLFHYCADHFLAHGHVEQFFLIVDLKNVDIFDVPLKKLKTHSNLLRKSY